MNKANKERNENILLVICFSAVILTIATLNNLTASNSEKPKLQNKNLESTSRMTYGRFLEYIEMGWVNQVDLYNNSRRAIVQASSPELGNRPQTIRVEIPVGATQLIQKLKEYNIDFDAHPVPQKNILITFANNLLIPLAFIIGLIFLFQESDNYSDKEEDSDISSMNPMDIIKSPARFDARPQTGITFNDIAGIDEAKAEFEELVSFLREPERYKRVGAKIPKGALLVGPPGTGKTLLAKAIATEADVPFYSVAGSEFVEMFIGIGAARIRDLFDSAAENAPCIIFIDEIDAVGRERGAGVGGGNDEREQTLNQLLTEMDGFKENKGVIVVGATNRVDILDPALLRPGRFDRQISVGLPDKKGRTAILKVHARNKRLANDVILEKVADRTPGFSGADLANILNESAILATRYKNTIITKNYINEAIDRTIGGIAAPPIEDSKYKQLIAYHEVGHAIVGTLLPNHDDVERITIAPRGNSKALTWFSQNEDQSLITRVELISRISMVLAGHLTEKIVFGETEFTTGGESDLQQATYIARQMVTRYGMSLVGPIAIENENNEVILENYKVEQIDSETTRILHEAEKTAYQILLDNRIIIDYMVELLIEEETLEGDEFRLILQQYTRLPFKDRGIEE